MPTLAFARAHVRPVAALPRGGITLSHRPATGRSLTPYLSTKVRPPLSDKASSPQGGSTRDPQAPETLARYAAEATRPRGKGEHDRKVLRFPAFRPRYAAGRSYYLDIWSYLQTWAFRTINDMQRDGYSPPTVEQLEALFADRIFERGRVWSEYDGKASGITSKDADQLAAEAAQAALRDWSATWIVGRREAGRKGGSASHRGPSKATPANLAALAALPPGTTARQAAVALGVSISTVARLRRLL